MTGLNATIDLSHVSRHSFILSSELSLCISDVESKLDSVENEVDIGRRIVLLQSLSDGENKMMQELAN
ncbi:MAG: hypothetical protein EZS28_001272 [Streblomastix strix]|uniref:Uncharacterized protein n=1 Tax=Streblomastix strix TaxID=222440 RepID=A0A5J4X9D4_9EUKA|nr:MAG: hypothetical protein EZS28_001272 [Streblomastix strix]